MSRVVIAGSLSVASVLAYDGDVDYSELCITVDPETGELITVNPGPRPKIHTNPPSISLDTNSINTATAQPVAGGPDPAGAQPAAGQTEVLFPVIVLMGALGLSSQHCSVGERSKDRTPSLPSQSMQKIQG